MSVLFPVVPQAPGVPGVLRQIGAVQNTIVLAVADAAKVVQALLGGVQWGLYDQRGTPVIVGDNVKVLDYRKEWRIATAPLEAGSFANYDKVELPADLRVTFTKGGSSLAESMLGGAAISLLGALSGSNIGSSVAARAQFLANVNRAAASLYAFNVLTPEIVYRGYSINHVDYRRDSREGVNLLTVDIWLSEIRPATSAGTGTNANNPSMVNPPIASSSTSTPTASTTPATQSPNAANPAQTGTVQPQTVTTDPALAGGSPSSGPPASAAGLTPNTFPGGYTADTPSWYVNGKPAGFTQTAGAPGTSPVWFSSGGNDYYGWAPPTSATPH